jgi:membrane protein
MLAGIKIILAAIKKGFSLLKRKDPLILSSSTAFFATFSISPIILLLLYVSGLYFKSERISNQVFRTLGGTIGTETAATIESIVSNFHSLEKNPMVTVLGSVFFLFVATTLLGVIKFAIQKIWSLRSKAQLKITYHSRERGIQLMLILFTGFLFGVSLFVDTSMAMSLDYLRQSLSSPVIEFIRVLNGVFSIIVVSVWFMIIFKYLPDANISWDTAYTGGFLTGILFSVGKFGLGKILLYSRFETVFGASASFALLLLFIFYSSFILYYGAAFTHAYGEMVDAHICAGKYAEEYEERTIRSRNPDQNRNPSLT